jgi:DNA mismatch repair protein MutS
VAEYLHDLKEKGVKTLFATHYHELTELAKTKERVKNFHIAVKEWNEEIIFLRKLVEGGTNRSYGIQVARLAGIPHPVISRAKKILGDIEQSRTGTAATRKSDKYLNESHVQMALFHNPVNEIARHIQALDISEMTPIEALNYLHSIKEKLK